MFNISPMEFVVIGIIALIVLGPARLPEVARNVGRGMREFRAAVRGATVSLDDDEDEEADDDFDDEIPDPPALPKSPPGDAEADSSAEPEPAEPEPAEDLPEGR